MKHLVALSGGKDSTAMAIRLIELYPNKDFTFFITPTGDELPEMDLHWSTIEDRIGQELIRLVDDKYPTIYDLIRHFGAMPNHRQRWCTRIMKIELAQQFYKENLPAKIYVGLRADEESRKGNTLLDGDIEQVFPLREWGWGIDEVTGYLNEKDVEIPRRTDCAMCFFQRIGEWWMLWNEHNDIFVKIADLEAEIGYTLMSPKKHKKWEHRLCDLATQFESGMLPREIQSGRRYNGCRMCTM